MNIKLICIILGLAFLNISCSDGLKSADLSSSSSKSCKTSSFKTAATEQQIIEPFKYSKISVEDFSNNDLSIQSASKPTNKILPRGKELALTVDVSCFLENSKKFKFDLFDIRNDQIRKRNPEYGNEEALHVYLKHEVSLSELSDAVNTEDCIIGVSNSMKLELASVPNDPQYTTQRHLASINHDNTYDFFFNSSSGIRNADIVVAVIDNGVDIDHPDLKNNIWKNTAELNGLPNVDDDKNGYIDDITGWDFGSGANITSGTDTFWQIYENNNPRPKPKVGTSGFSLESNHGTHVSGLIGAVSNNSLGVTGVMSNKIKIMALNAWGNSEAPSIAVLAKSIRYAANNGAKIINMSLGAMGKSTEIENALAYAIGKGAFIVSAAGNNNALIDEGTNSYLPASYSKQFNGMVSVAAVNASGVSSRCSFSNYSNSIVEIAAPGCDSAQSKGLLSTFINNFADTTIPGYGFMNGTSQATPVISGVAAIAISMVRDYAGKTLTPAEAETTVVNGSATYSTLNNYVVNGKVANLNSLQTYIQSNFDQVSIKCP